MEDFFFEDLDIRRKAIASEKNNGTVRATMDGPVHMLREDSSWFGSKKPMWEQRYGVMTNIGFMIFD